MRETDGPRPAGVRFALDTYEEPPLFASSIEEPRRHSGLSIWFAAAGSLVLGILIGFGSGYRVGQGLPGAAVAEPGASNSAPTSGGQGSTGQTFSESAVGDPVRLDPQPIVPAPDVQAGPRQRPERGAEPAPPVAAPPVGRVPPRTALREGPAVAADPPDRQPATGPGSLQVVSRPAGAQVFLDGRLIGRTPLLVPDVAAGEHGIRLELPGFNRWATNVDVKPGDAMRVAASLEQ